VESPNTQLDPEKFLQAELGIRGGAGSWEWQTSYYYTWIKDMIVRSPIESGKSDVLKSNGDGLIQGVELELGYQWTPSWKSDLLFSWMDGEVEQMQYNNATGTVAINGRNYSPVKRATTRLMPIQTKFSTQYKPAGSNWSSVLSFLAVSKADDLSLKDETDLTRIPSNGTPGYLLTNIYGNYDISDTSSISLALENIGDVDYRVHGSGLNGAGRNFILSCSIVF
jgi:outer membrane receptor protein involved in Fe transport